MCRKVRVDDGIDGIKKEDRIVTSWINVVNLPTKLKKKKHSVIGNNLTQLFERSGGTATTTELLHMGIE